MPFISTPIAWQGIVLLVAGALLRAMYVIANKKNLQRRFSSRFLLAVNMLGASAILWIAMIAFTKPTFAEWMTFGILAPLIATALLNVILQYCDTKALELEDASLVHPMSAAAPLLSILAGLMFLRELPTPAGWVGIALLSVGSYVLNASKPGTDGATSAITQRPAHRHLHRLRELLLPWRRLGKSRGLRLAFVGAALASVSITFDKMVVIQTNPLFLGAVGFGFVGIVLAASLHKNDIPRSVSARMLFRLGLTPVLGAVGYILFAFAFYYSLASGASALRRLSILFVVLLAAPLLRERGHPERIWGGVIMTVGAILLAF